jgi:transcriptional activator of cad operon
MERTSGSILRIGDWRVDPASGEIARADSSDGETIRLEVRSLRLLLCLAERAGEVVSIDELLDRVWAGVNVTPDSVYQGVATLRRALGDDSRQPTYIETVPRLGYRMVADVGPWNTVSTDSLAGLVPGVEPDSAGASNDAQASESASLAPKSPPAGMKNAVRTGISRSKSHRNWILPLAIGLALAVILLLLLVRNNTGNGKASTQTGVTPPAQGSAEPGLPLASVGVVPFLDLTQGMHEGEFVDGMTEELIDQLSKVPGFRVPSPTASFYFKDKQLSVPEIAKGLGVAYLLDGSVRKSGNRVRIAARLVRADTGFILWTETYDRPMSDILMVQQDIAREVTQALKSSIQGRAPAQ